MSTELIVLRLVHILGGIFWLGSGLFTTLALVKIESYCIHGWPRHHVAVSLEPLYSN